MNASEIRRAWDATIYDWQTSGVRYARGGEDPGTGLDCFLGVMRLLYREAGIEFPAYVGPAGGDHSGLGYAGAETFREQFERIDREDARIGDVLVFSSIRRSHVAVCLDNLRAVDIGFGGVAVPTIDDLCDRHRASVYRYTGDGHDRFGE